MSAKLAIAIPVYKQFEDLDFSEKISWKQTCKVLGKHDIYLVTHQEIILDAYKSNSPSGIQTIIFNKFYFENIDGYNKLLLSLDFYNAFRAYEYLLICQLDVFVFSDLSGKFIKKGYDYIGAPWFENFHNATKESKIIGVGNGGFSLRKVKSFLKVLSLFEVFRNPSLRGIKELSLQPYSFLKIAKHEWYRKRRSYIAILPWQFKRYEDIYWSEYVKLFFPWFSIASVEDAIAFSFEVNPDVLYVLNNHQLPMATHAWQKYNSGFWKPFIAERGYLFD